MSQQTTEATLRFVDNCVASMDEAIQAEAYVAAAEYADGIARVLRALNDRLVRERVKGA